MTEVGTEVLRRIGQMVGHHNGRELTEADALIDIGLNSVDWLEMVYVIERRFKIDLWAHAKDRITLTSSTIGDVIAVVEDAIAAPERS